MNVIDNLKDAIRGESEAKVKYNLFAETARKENLTEVAYLFKAIAIAENIHIENHIRALNLASEKKYDLRDIVSINHEKLASEVTSSLQNLKSAIAGEFYESKKMYKKFEKNARKVRNNVAELSFSLARQAERIHANLYDSYLKKLNKGENINPKTIYVCQICGNVEFEKPPENCPICDHNETFFKKIDKI